ncbi:hypothetical protein GLP14_02025 [Photobacterium carnosum]|uniref:hypothetical protein n=1 Tax=Photobacterium carnosum TaxID=2023717 RepID=UPI001E59055B|nr:hypothetical protein [Photobacterium carnosum]MCD9494252.1 hypothetical protein [Photobacterium carnosum]MCD9521617.1 hypothetical protein [Photobacterium carnosum]
MVNKNDGTLRSWLQHLNSIIGMLLFTMFLACLGTDTPGINAFISLVLVSIFNEGFKRKHSNLKRQLSLYKKINKISDVKLFFSNPLFTIGYILLCLLFFSHVMLYFFPNLPVPEIIKLWLKLPV